MPDNQASPLKRPTRVPWNKGKLIGPKPPLPAKARLVDQDPIDD